MIDREAEALTAFPELRGLVDLGRLCWEWLDPARDDTGHVVEIHGVRNWPSTGQVDAIRVRSATDAAGVRIDHEGGVLWQREGGLVDVVNGLRELPEPGTPGAPCLVKRVLPGLWTP